MSTNFEMKQNAVVTCQEVIETSDGQKKRIAIDYDLSDLKRIIECDGMEYLVKTLRDLHHQIVEASLLSMEKGEHGIFDNNPDLTEQLFYLKAVTDCFDESRQETLQLKDWPIVVESLVNA